MRWLAVVMVLAKVASADVRSPFVIVDQLDGVSRVGFDVTSLSTRSGVRFLVADVHGHVVEPRTKLGGYVRMQWLHWSDHRFYADPYERSPSYSALNNPTAGIVWSRSLSARLALIAHADVTPSLSASDGRPIRATSLLLRPSTFYAALPGVSSTSAGGSLLWRDGRTIVRADVGGHLVIHGASWTGGGTHINAAAAVNVTEKLTMGLELSTLWLDLADDVYEAPHGLDRTAVAVLAVLGVSTRYRIGHVQLYAAAAFPLRKYPAEDVSGGVTLGFEGSF